MKEKAITACILALTTLLIGCVNRMPEVTESAPHSGDTSPSTDGALDNIAEEYEFLSVGTEDYRVEACNYREVTILVDGAAVSGMTLYSCEEEVDAVIIPEEVNGQPVIAIGLDERHYTTPVFSLNTGIKRVVIPKSVFFIGTSAFSRCTELTDLALPFSIKYIGSYAFSNCPGLKEIRITPDLELTIWSLCNAVGLSKVIFEEGVTFFPNFCDCESLTELELPSTITSLGLEGSGADLPYLEGSSVTFLDIPEGVTFMCGRFFLRSMIESIVIPTTLADYEKSSFENCPLKEVFFRGTEEQCPRGLKTIFAELEVPLYYLSETEPTEEGNFWHYVDGQPVIW